MTYLPRTTLPYLEFSYLCLLQPNSQHFGHQRSNVPRIYLFCAICKGNGSERRVVRRFLDTGDKNSTSNMRKHAKHCWGDEIIKKADEAVKDELTVENIRQTLAEAKKAQDGSIIAFFDRKGKGRVKYMMRQHTYEEARSVLDKIQSDDNTLTAFKVLNTSAGVLRVWGASILWMMQAFTV